MAQIGSFAAQAEQAGFESVGVIDRLVYDNLDPLIALAAAAARTSRIGLISTVVNDVVLYPCSGDLDQIERLSQALRSATAVPDA
jgi:alkanesulfonate monooxygenase SsuD/methylene tetrahydromethanopterin reductase-like flavin-dependent oxidoreductase (luciferase family)